MDRPLLRRVEMRARRMQDMVDALDVDEVALIRARSGEGYSQARSKCLHCYNADECLHWLKTDDRSDNPPEFCPNFELFVSCKR
ncbi:MAG: DUF6455 family protein [Filomicrobium sp.]